MEPIQDPALPICDPHHHLMDAHGYRYSSADLMSDIDSGHRVTRSVYIECGNAVRAYNLAPAMA